MRIHVKLAALLACSVLLFAAGCDDHSVLPQSAETDEPSYRQAKQLDRQGRSQEALSFYLKVIAKRSESAPESHLDAGMIYLRDIKDPITAIYHFRKYLELQPNSAQAGRVRGLVETAKREFARTLQPSPLDNQADKIDYIDQLDKLQRENDQLKAEIATIHGTTVPAASLPRPAFSTAPTANGATTIQAPTPVTLAGDDERSPITPVQNQSPVQVVQSSPAPAPVAESPRQTPTAPTAPPPAAAKRKHTVGKGDTLMSLALRYYGNRSKWRDIYAANRDTMRSESDLRIGMELRIP